MEQFQIIQLGLALLGGGAAGALITAAVTTYRNRVQPVGYRVDKVPLFRGGVAGLPYNVSVSLNHPLGGFYHFDNLYIYKLEIANRGNQDRKSFTFGIALPPTQRAVLIEAKNPDRHHRFSSIPDASPTAPLEGVDFTVEPFNRGDRYSLILYVNLEQPDADEGNLEFSSPEPVVFTPMPTVGEISITVGEAIATRILGKFLP